MKRTPPLVSITLVLGLLGLSVAIAWLFYTGAFALPATLRPGYVLLLVSLTVVNVATRFLRWHFLLRRVAVKIPTRASLAVYLSSLAAIATPAYLGELLRPVLVRRRFGAQLSRTVAVVIAERVLDAVALGIIAAAASGFGMLVSVMLVLGAVLARGLIVVGLRGRWRNALGAVLEPLTRASVLLPALALSMLAWVPAAATVHAAARALGAPVSPLAGAGVFSRSTLVGGISLMPAGIATTGSVAILSLRNLGLDLATAVQVVTLLRAGTAGLTLAVGLVFLVLALRRSSASSSVDSREHFDAIADVYDRQLPSHVRTLLATRKADAIHASLARAETPMVRGLDLGCGQGAYCVALERRGYRIVGLDPSVRSVSRAKEAGARVVAASGLELPFREASFDFVFAIGVLHHIAEGAPRAQALEEIRRVLRPHGRLLVHETNPTNPLFRFYMGYVFPILRAIDEGTEQWLHPTQHRIAGMTCLTTEYGTFLPDFAPEASLPLLLALERRLEHSRWRRFSAHYLSVFRLDDEAAEPRSVAGRAG